MVAANSRKLETFCHHHHHIALYDFRLLLLRKTTTDIQRIELAYRKTSAQSSAGKDIGTSQSQFSAVQRKNIDTLTHENSNATINLFALLRDHWMQSLKKKGGKGKNNFGHNLHGTFAATRGFKSKNHSSGHHRRGPMLQYFHGKKYKLLQRSVSHFTCVLTLKTIFLFVFPF